MQTRPNRVFDLVNFAYLANMRKMLLCLLICLAVSCIERPKPPSGTLSQAEMVQILTDIHIAEGKTSRLSFRSQDSSKVMFKKFEQDILNKYHTDTTTYRKSVQFYLENTSYMDEIYQAVLDSLNLREKLGKID